MIPSMLDPPGPPITYGLPQPPATTTTDIGRPGSGYDDTTRAILEVVFIAIAIFALVLCFLFRLMCLRRENRPLKDFLKPLPPPSAPQPRHDREASPHPSHSTTRSEQMRQTIFLPTLPIAAPQHPPAVYTVPGVPTLAHPGGDGLAGVAAHPPGFSGEMRGMHGHKFCTPPLYDAKDAPPRYEEAVLHGPGASDASSPGRPPGVGRQELRRSASQ